VEAAAHYSPRFVRRLLGASLRPWKRLRQTGCVRAIALTLALAVVSVVAWDASAHTERRATLRLVDVAPVTFRGSAFAPREDVRVVLVRQSRRFVRNAQANGRGTFRVRFGLVALDACRGAVTVSASGDRGSRATYRRPCRPLPRA
jgi:hypothetical protein